jgi:galactose mutarotase-like enzyme
MRMDTTHVIEAMRATRTADRRGRSPRLHGLSGGTHHGHPVCRLSSYAHDLHATFVPDAALLGLSLRHRGEELLALPQDLGTYVRTGAATGIPLLHPWANRLAGFEYVAARRRVRLAEAAEVLQLDDGGLPIHGVVGGRPGFRVLRSGADGERAWLTAELDFGARPALLNAFPFPHRLRVDVELRASVLRFRTTLVPTTPAAVPIAFGYHPYLRLPGIGRADWELALPARSHLDLDARGLPTGGCAALRAERAPLGERSFDDLFGVGEGPVTFGVAGGGRELAVELRSGYPYTQVFAPAGEDFICLEPMTAPVNALGSGEGLRLAQRGSAFTAEWRLEVRNAAGAWGTEGP